MGNKIGGNRMGRFAALVDQVQTEKLKPAKDLSSLEQEIDRYIQERQVAYVVEDCRFYVWWGDQWVRLTWAQLRRDCPPLFGVGTLYKKSEALVMRRLKVADRIYKSVKYTSVQFL